jgi:biopolymer transport protein ExbD
MKYTGYVCLIAVTSALLAAPRASGQTPALQKGVSVQLANTRNAVAFPAADNEDAWVVTVTADGQLYIGMNPATPEQLREEMKTTPRRRDARLYIKADARAPFAAVKQALLAAHEDFFETVVLLTQQAQNLSSGSIVPPHGLEVNLALPSAKPILVQLRDSGNITPEVKVNDQEIPWSSLEGALRQASRGQGRKIVVIEADRNLQVASLINAIDLSRLSGADVAISLMDF